MTQREKDLILSWLYNEEIRIENDVVELQNRVRFRKIGVNDCVELALTLQRLDDFREFALVVLRLLDLEKYT